MKRLLVSWKMSAFLIGCILPGSLFAQDVTLDLWPGGAPNETASIGAEEVLTGGSNPEIKRMTNVTRPRIEVFRAPKGSNTGTAILVCPGGGYNILAFDHEGLQVVRWLNSIGVTGVLLKYRVPRREGRDKHAAPLEDAQRAMSLVRKHADQWGINPQRVGMMGFSAGGHLTLTTGTNFGQRTYKLDPEIDRFSCRPDFLIPVYPAYLVEAGDQGALPPEIRVTEETPPAFLAHAGDDKHSAEGSVRIYLALKKLGIPAELHIYANGGHGFGMRKSENPVSTWTDRCEDWMRNTGWLPQR